MEAGFIWFLWFILAGGVAALASNRGRSAIGFFLLSLFFSPVLGLIVVLVIRDLNKDAADEQVRQQEQKKQEQLRKEEHERQLESIRAIAPAAHPSAAAPPKAAAPSASSVADEIIKLLALKDRGVLTDDEFAAQKTALLNSRRP